ncbi:MAG TPA: hypothetical protein VFD37_00155, partial [Solirubrobacterales bacterium]|nr:hypothetical protein [Solirubrobacterales bacterium]
MHASPRRKALISLIAIVGLGSLAAYGIHGAFSATTSNAGNEFSSATLELTSSNNATSEPVIFATNAVPGDSGETDHSCIEITYDSQVPAEVSLYDDTTDEGTGLAAGILLKITEGEGGVGDCQGFTANGTEGDVF